MNRNAVKNYAPAARRDFIRAVKARANTLGISENGIELAQVLGDVAIISGRAFPAEFASRREKLVESIRLRGYEQVVEEAAYTWFNRFVALRFMEVNGWLKCGCMVLGSTSESGLPAILDHISELDESSFPDADLARARELRLAGDREEELYRLLLIAQCNALHASMPLLFERVSDASELLLPDNLLYSDSIIRRMVQAIPDEDWQTVEIIGWLYQFYISEKKDEVIGKTVKTEDIPAATQLFTPNWIVQYMVQNTLGRQWLASNADSSLRESMPYYIEPAEQEPEVQAQLDATLPDSIEPEQMTFLDPACGSGHILVEAYNVFKRIYQERGYRARTIPRLILEKNLYGLDIDPRAAQLSQFALLMLARKDDMRILDNPPAMNIMALGTSRKWDKFDGSWAQGNEKVDALAKALLGGVRQTVSTGRPEQMTLVQTSPVQVALPSPEAVSKDELAALLQLFADADTFGSLIRVPAKVKNALPRLKALMEAAKVSDSMDCRIAAEEVAPLVRQAELLARQYDCVVANPPYMGGKGMNAKLKEFLKNEYEDVKSDLFSAFIIRNFELAREHGQLGFMSPFVWMFISSYEKLRGFIIDQKCITSLIQLEYSGFDGATVPICTYTFRNSRMSRFRGGYIRLSDFRGAENQGPKTLEAIQNKDCGWFFTASAEDFKKIPGSPVAYWSSEKIKNCFSGKKLKESIETREGLTTGDNNKFLRLWHEVNINSVGFNIVSNYDSVKSEKKFFTYIKGGEFRKWWGNFEYVVNWFKNGEELKSLIDPLTGRVRSHNYNGEYAFRTGFTWSGISSGIFAVRHVPYGLMFDAKAPMGFTKSNNSFAIEGFLNSSVTNHLIKMLAPTLDFKLGHILNLPHRPVQEEKNKIQELIQIAQSDWDSYETSWDFKSLPLLRPAHRSDSLANAYAHTRADWQAMTDEMKELEEENNRIFIDAYELQDELTPDVPLKEITLTCNPFYRYGEDGENATEEKKLELEARLKADSVKELISYAIGCMMGRYSLDEEGLVYASAGNEGFDASRYVSFPTDDDGILALTDEAWFEDDAASRFREFCKAVWGEETLEQNMQFMADQLEPKAGEAPDATIRRWLSTKFFKDWHLKTYKKRPIYWLFSSGKQKAFECLVYLHRYNENTLPRMRASYVTPLQSKIASRLELLEHQIGSAASTASRNALKKQRDSLIKKQDELRRFDDLLRHYADQRIALDLDDGVKVNYAKLGELLAETKAITGGKED